jgi:hypothetical protein
LDRVRSSPHESFHDFLHCFAQPWRQLDADQGINWDDNQGGFEEGELTGAVEQLAFSKSRACHLIEERLQGSFAELVH